MPNCKFIPNADIFDNKTFPKYDTTNAAKNCPINLVLGDNSIISSIIPNIIIIVAPAKMLFI